MKQRSDTGAVELAGRSILVNELLAAGVEVASPVRDRGFDIIAYLDNGSFKARPIQLKASSGSGLGIDAKYDRFPDLVHVFLWQVIDGAPSPIFALRQDDIYKIATASGWLETESWRKDKRYSRRNIGKALLELMAPYRMRRERWRPVLFG
jgi:hypothetical protein